MYAWVGGEEGSINKRSPDLCLDMFIPMGEPVKDDDGF